MGSPVVTIQSDYWRYKRQRAYIQSINCNKSGVVIYSICTQNLVEWTEQQWRPSAFLIDRSNIESKAVQRTFRGARILRCTRHSTKNLKAKLSHVEEALYHTEKAIFAGSLSDCPQNIQESINKCPYSDLKRYLLSKWTVEPSYSWSLHGRLDTPMLREITTINPSESYHYIHEHKNEITGMHDSNSFIG